MTLVAEYSESEESIQEHTASGNKFGRRTTRSCKAASLLLRPLQIESSYQNGYSEEPK